MRLSTVHPNPARLSAVVLLREAKVALACVAVTNEGLTVRVPAAKAQWRAGQLVTLCALQQDDAVLLQEQPCAVESTHCAGDGVWLVKLRFQPRDEAGTPLRIANGSRVRAVIAAGHHFSAGADDGSISQRFSGAQLGAQTLLLGGPQRSGSSPWLPGHPLTLRFEHEGRALQGYARLVRVTEAQWEVALPLVLIELPPRGALHASAEQVQTTLSLVSPLSGQVLRRWVLELSTRGARFACEPHDALPPGLRVEAVLELGGAPLALAAVVETVGRGECRLRFEAMSELDRLTLIEFLACHRIEGAANAEGLASDTLSSLFRSEGVAPPRPPRPAPGLSKAFVLLRDGEPVGHVSGLRIYSRTWLSGHLLVKADVHDAATRAQQLMTLSLEAGEAMADVEYVRALWRMSSRNAAHIQGASSPRLLRSGLVYRTSFEQLRLPLGPLPEPGPLFVREAGPDDERAFLAFVGATEEAVKLLSDDLVPGELHLESLSPRFGAAGLSRGRALTVVEDEHGAPLGWALLQSMSAGLAWAELHSAFRLFVPEPQGPHAAAARRSLCAHAARYFAALGRGEAVCHAAPADLPSLLELGFVSQGAICEFGAHRSALPDFARQLVSVLTRLPQRETKRRVHRSPRGPRPLPRA